MQNGQLRSKHGVNYWLIRLMPPWVYEDECQLSGHDLLHCDGVPARCRVRLSRVPIWMICVKNILV